MTKSIHHIEFRTEQPAPTEPGWYWGRWRQISGDPISPIEPLAVIKDEGRLVALYMHGGWFILRAFDWFGPVTMVKEGSAGE